MKSNKGFSLIEILIAIVMLSIICVGMLPALSTQFMLIRRTRAMTESLFQAQQLIEQRIEEVKQSVKNGTTPIGTKATYTLFSGTNQRVVNGYANTVQVNYGTNTMEIYAVAAEMKPLIFDVPTATNVLVEFNNGATIPYAYTSTASMFVKSSYTKVDPKNVFLVGIHRWYVSRSGFNTPNILDPFKKFELEKGTVYPRFPEDYTLVTGAVMKDLTTIKTAYAGRHLLYTITPAATSGKMGATEVSNAVFISGLPVTNNLALHFDASMISIETDAASGALREVTTNSGGNIITQYFVKQWNDISGNLNGSSQRFKALQTTTGMQPELVQIKMGNMIDSGKEYETYAKYLRFAGAQGMTVADDNLLDFDNITVFAVTRSTEITKDKTIVSKVRNVTNDMDTWYLGWDMGDVGIPSVDNRLAFYVRANNNTRISTALEADGVGLDGNWHILTGTSQYNTDTMLSKTTLQLDKNTVIEDARTFNNSIVNNSPITIGFDGGTNFSTVDIAEIIIYNGKLSDTDIESVQQYLTDKYQPEPPVVTIYALQKPQNEVAAKGATFVLPTKLKANMSNGTIQEVDVTWSPETTVIDTTTVGTKVNTATAVANSSKTTTLTVDVSAINKIEDVSITLLKNTSYTLPDQVTAILDNGKSTLVDVTWNNPNVDTSVIGLITRTAVADLDATKTMTLRIDIVPVAVTGINLNKTAVTLNRTQTEALVADVVPNNASNMNVLWSSDDAAVASVSSSGVITANALGTAQITATTEDGNYVATCDVIVEKSLQEILDEITTLVIVNPTNTNTQAKPQLMMPASVDGVTFSFVATSSTFRFDVLTGIITRHTTSNRTITVTLQGNDNGVTLDKVFTVYIPSNNSTPVANLMITVTE